VFLVFLLFLICHYKTAHLTHKNISFVNFCWGSCAGVFGIFSIGAAMQLGRRVFAAVAQWL
jgi:hypothetical protein